MNLFGKRTTGPLGVVLFLALASQAFALTTGETVSGVNGTTSYPGMTIQSITRSYDDSVNRFSMTLAAAPGVDYFSALGNGYYAYAIMISPNVTGAIDAYNANPISTYPRPPTNAPTYFEQFAAGSPAYGFNIMRYSGTSTFSSGYGIAGSFYDGDPSTIPGYSFTVSGNVLTWTIPKSEVSFDDFAWLGITSFGGNVVNGTNYAVASAPSPVPVPGAVWLFGSGLLGLVGIRRRRMT